MRLLVATYDTNGDDPRDYGFCVEGELVHLQEPCGRDLRDPDGPCGCGRGFSGLSSHRGITTARVVESRLGPDEVRIALEASLEAGGWLDPAWRGERERADVVAGHLEIIQAIAANFTLGRVIRRRLWKFNAGTAMA